jgi:hypothetical protein
MPGSSNTGRQPTNAKRPERDTDARLKLTRWRVTVENAVPMLRSAHTLRGLASHSVHYMVSTHLGIGVNAPLVYTGYQDPIEDFRDQSEKLMSRLETLRSVETELSKVREVLTHPDDSVLRYLIDLVIAEVQNAYRDEPKPDRKKFPMLVQIERSEVTVCGRS